MVSGEDASATGFVTGQGLLRAVQSTVALGRADVAVAFWGPKAVDLLGMPADAAGIRVACDAFSGSCSPKALAELLRRGAKVYFGNGTLVVGSANASANGFGQDIAEDGLALEAASVSRQAGDLEAASEWLRRVYREGIVVTVADLPRVREARDARPSPVPKPIRPSFLKLLLDDPDWFSGRRLRVCMYDSEAPSHAARQAYRESEFFTTQEAIDEVSWPYYWSTEDWVVSEGDLILDFIRSGKKVGCTGVWRVLGQVERGAITAVEYVSSPQGLRFSQTDMTSLGKAVTRYGMFTEDRRWDLLDIVPFARELRDWVGASGD